MGMAASQARILLLTARKSDLELRGQQITQRKMVLSMDMEDLASDYTRAISNRILQLNWSYIANDSKMLSTTLTYDELTSSSNSQLVAPYRVVNGKGDIVIRNEKDPVLYDILYVEVPKAKVSDADMKYYDEENGVLQIATIDSNGNISGTCQNYACSDAGRKVVGVGELIDDTFLFQNAIRQGTLQIESLNYDQEQYTDEEGNVKTRYLPTGEWNIVNWSGSECFGDVYYKDDDAIAEAVYQTKLARVQTMDKKLDTELKQVETQQKSCQNEMESVKKVLDKNVEDSFKTFG